MSSDAAMDVTNAEIQDDIANSLLGDEAEYSDVDEQPETDPDEQVLSEAVEDSLVDNPEQEETEQPEFEEQQETEYEQPTEEAPTELTPQAIQESIQSLDRAVTELGLNDEAAAMRLAQDLTVPFGTDPSGINSQALGQTMSKVVISAARIFDETGGDLSQVGAIPRDSAVAFTNEFLRSWGIDPRTSQVNPEHFASVMFQGTMNFLQAASTYGLDASMDRLNMPEAAEAFANAVHQCFGINQPVTRERALAIADAGGKYIISTLKKLDALQQSQAAQRPARQSRSAQTRQSRPGQRFRTNSDLFDEDTLSLLQTRL